MVATSPYADPTLPERVYKVEQTVQEHAVTLATQEQHGTHLASAVQDLKSSVVWNNRALVTLCVTIAGSAALLNFG